MAAGDFYDPGPLKHVAINLFYGWGYNFYRKENQLRADDQLVRGKAAWLLGTARASIDAAESAYRREFLPPPTRANPIPDPGAVAGAQAIERLSRSVGALASRIQGQPAPEEDRMTQRYRQEAATLATLVERDQILVGQADLLRSMIDGRDGPWVLENLPALESGVHAIETTLRDRAALLQGMAS